MVDRAFYEQMSRDQLIARLKVAEDALVLVGWTATNLSELRETPRTKAAEQMWSIWCSMVGLSFTDPDMHPDLDAKIPELAAQRDRTRADTLRYFFGDPDAGAKGDEREGAS